MASAFAGLVDPYPEALPPTPPSGFVPFVWAASAGLRRCIVLMIVFTATIGVFEALLFAMLGKIVGWLGPVQPQRLWVEYRLSLLPRFFDVESGRILIDGHDIAQVTQDSLHARIGMMTQDTSLLHRSVSDNILYGLPEASDEQMRAAARQAEADGFMQGLSDANKRSGYDAHVGERGVKLSGGQRQRIAIARVMLKDAPILLLDEATSALDSEVEAVVQTSLYRLMHGKTAVAIAHRLSTIAATDRLIVIDKGRIVEQADHPQPAGPGWAVGAPVGAPERRPSGQAG